MSTSRVLSCLLPLAISALSVLLVPACVGEGGSGSWGNDVFTAAETEESNRLAPVEVPVEAEEAAEAARVETATETEPSVSTGLEANLRDCDARLRQGLVKEVLPTLEELHRQHPESVPVLLALGRALLALDQPQRALALLQHASKLDSLAADLPRLLGIALLSSKKTEEGLGVLRQELAEGLWPADAALVLAAHFTAREALADALACLQQAATRQPERQDLWLRQAALLVDMNRPAEALQVLERLAGESGNSAEACLEKLIALRMLGRCQAALDLLQKLLAEKKTPPGEQEEFRRVESDLRQEIKLGRRLSYLDRELLAMLRAAPSVSVRVRSLRRLVLESQLHAERAINLALGDRSHIVRAEGVRQAMGRSENPLYVLRLGLSDSVALVRAVAAEMGSYLGAQPLKAARNGPEPQAKEQAREVEALLLEFLEQEPDPYAFRQMHEALERVTGTRVDLPYKGEYEAKTRQKVVAAWRSRR